MSSGAWNGHASAPTPAKHGFALLLLLSLGGCSADPVGEVGGEGLGGGAASCLPPSRLVDGACREPGIQDDGCAAGRWLGADGNCHPAGISPAMCTAGFVPTDQGGCEPILPADPCGPGLMALPGDSDCRQVMECGAGRWGEIPVDGSTLYVDQSYDQAAGPSDGTEGRPYTTVGEAVAAAPSGTLVAIAPGSYVEDQQIQGKRLHLWGKCPADVELVGTGAGLATVVFLAGADGSELTGLAIRGAAAGVAASGAEDLVLSQLWIHDNSSLGAVFESTLGPTSAAIHGSLIENNHEIGVFVNGSVVALETSVVRGTLAQASAGMEGRGVSIQSAASGDDRASVSVSASAIEYNQTIGIAVASSDLELEASVVRGTLPTSPDQSCARGVNIQPTPTSNIRSTAVLRSSLIEHHHEVGVLVGGSDARLEAMVVRGLPPQLPDQTVGLGISIQHDPATGRPSRTSVHHSLIERTQDIGVFVVGSNAELEAIIVRGTTPRVADQLGGRGISLQYDLDTGAPARAMVRSALVENNHEIGVFVGSADADLRGMVVRGTRPRALDGLHGQGIHFRDDPHADVQPSMLLQGSRIENNHEFGVAVVGTTVRLLGVAIAETAPSHGPDLFGDGVVVVGDARAAMAELSSIHVDQSARAGLAVFGAAASIRTSALSCNSIDMAREPYRNREAALTDGGDNHCSCGDELLDCTAVSVGLDPPEPITAPE